MRIPFQAILTALLPLICSCESSVKQNYLTEEKQAEYISKGKIIVQQSLQALSGELKGALTTGGVQNAVGYCHLKASPIIDSLSSVYQVKISRSSDKYRNPENHPSPLDSIVIAAYIEQVEQGQSLQPHLEIEGQNIIFYAPISIQNPMCLLCHGDPGVTIEQVNYDFIRSKYPYDLASGYKLNDLRGVWKIEF